jgi:hypothetical protein
MTKSEMLTNALVLAVTAPSEKQSKDATRLAICISMDMKPEIVKQCKNQAELILKGAI